MSETVIAYLEDGTEVSVTLTKPDTRVPSPGEIWENEKGHRRVILEVTDSSHINSTFGTGEMSRLGRGCHEKVVTALYHKSPLVGGKEWRLGWDRLSLYTRDGSPMTRIGTADQ